MSDVRRCGLSIVELSRGVPIPALGDALKLSLHAQQLEILRYKSVSGFDVSGSEFHSAVEAHIPKSKCARDKDEIIKYATADATCGSAFATHQPTQLNACDWSRKTGFTMKPSHRVTVESVSIASAGRWLASP